MKNQTIAWGELLQVSKLTNDEMCYENHHFKVISECHWNFLFSKSELLPNEVFQGMYY